MPERGLFLTAGVDVQKDRIEVEVVAWGRSKETVGRLPGDRGRHRAGRGVGEAGRGARSGLATRERPDAADPGDVRRRGLCHPGCIRLGPAASAGELGPGRRRGPAAAHRGGGEGPRLGHGAAALGVAGRRRRQATRAAGVVGRHAGRQGRAVPLAEAGVADRGGARRRCELSARRLPLPAVRRRVLPAAHRRAAGHPHRQGLPARLLGEGAGPAQRGARLPGLRPGRGRDLRARPVSRSATGGGWRKRWRERSSGMWSGMHLRCPRSGRPPGR